MFLSTLSCNDIEGIEQRKSFLDISNWEFVSMKYTIGHVVKNNGSYVGPSPNELTKCYNGGTFRILDTTFLFCRTNEFREYSGKSIWLYADNDTINANVEHVAFVLVRTAGTDSEMDWDIFIKQSTLNSSSTSEIKGGLMDVIMTDDEEYHMFFTIFNNSGGLGKKLILL